MIQLGALFALPPVRCVTISLGLSVLTYRMGGMRQSLPSQSATKMISEISSSCLALNLLMPRL